jgi:uncharacterized membrane protein YhaH (DUF805 family)
MSIKAPEPSFRKFNLEGQFDKEKKVEKKRNSEVIPKSIFGMMRENAKNKSSCPPEKPEDMPKTFFGWYIRGWKKCFTFKGRARRKEYWTFFLINGLPFVIFIAFFSPWNFFETLIMPIMAFAFGPWWLKLLIPTGFIAIFIPICAITVRRLHDIGMGGWGLVLGFIPYVGGLVLFVLALLDGEPRENQYGVDPKYRVKTDYITPRE